jgi:hypothetical protein
MYPLVQLLYANEIVIKIKPDKIWERSIMSWVKILTDHIPNSLISRLYKGLSKLNSKKVIQL